MRVLICDDEELIRGVIKEYLYLEDYEVVEAKNGAEAIEIAENEDIDLIIMDIMMPKMDGYEGVKKIKETKDIPVIMLSARQEEFDKLRGFDLGIDDYMTKPFSPKELIARIKAIMKRKNIVDDESKKIVVDSLVIDDLAHEVTIDGKIVNLTPKEYDLLKFLVENANIALSREQLLTKIWGYDFYGDDRTVDTHIKTLRNQLGIYKDRIITIRKVGYKFENK